MSCRPRQPPPKKTDRLTVSPRKTIMLEKPQPKEPWMKRFAKEWDAAVGRIRNVGTTKRDYVALLTRKEGTEVKAVRMNGYEKQQDLQPVLSSDYPDWNVKGIWRLFAEDFE